MINLRLYTEVLKQDIPDDHEGLSILRGIVIGYLTRVIYNKQEGIEKAIGIGRKKLFLRAAFCS